jgi:hypothetical protein
MMNDTIKGIIDDLHEDGIKMTALDNYPEYSVATFSPPFPDSLKDTVDEMARTYSLIKCGDGSKPVLDYYMRDYDETLLVSVGDNNIAWSYK